jgi:hypothetical protein
MITGSKRNIKWIPSDWLLYINSILSYCIPKGTRNKFFVLLNTVPQPLNLLKSKNGY